MNNAILLAPQVIQYDVQLGQAEQNFDEALRVDEVEHYLQNQRWDEARKKLSNISFSQVRSIELRKKLDTINQQLEKQNEAKQKIINSQKIKDWKAALDILAEVKASYGLDDELKSLEQETIQIKLNAEQFTSFIEQAKKLIKDNKFAQAKEAVDSALEIKHDDKEALSLLVETNRYIEMNKSLDEVRLHSQNREWEKSLTILNTIPLNFLDSSVLRDMANQCLQWRSKLAIARKEWRAKDVLDLLNTLPRGEIDQTELRQWAEKTVKLQERIDYAKIQNDFERVISLLETTPKEFPEREIQLKNYRELKGTKDNIIQSFKIQDFHSIHSILKQLPNGHVLKDTFTKEFIEEIQSQMQRAKEIYDFNKMEELLAYYPNDNPVKSKWQNTIDELQEQDNQIKRLRQVYVFHTVLLILEKVNGNYPNYQELKNWAETEKTSQQEIRSALQEYDLPKAKACLKTLPKDHPDYVKLYNWVESEENTRNKLNETLEKSNIDEYEKIFSEIDHYHPEWEYWNHSLIGMKDLQKKVFDCMQSFNVEKVLSVQATINQSHPLSKVIFHWLEDNQNLDQEISELMESFDFENFESQLSRVSDTHPQKKNWEKWLNEQKQLAKNIQLAKVSNDQRFIQLLLTQIPGNHPKAKEWNDLLQERNTVLVQESIEFTKIEKRITNKDFMISEVEALKENTSVVNSKLNSISEKQRVIVDNKQQSTISTGNRKNIKKLLSDNKHKKLALSILYSTIAGLSIMIMSVIFLNIDKVNGAIGSLNLFEKNLLRKLR